MNLPDQTLKKVRHILQNGIANHLRLRPTEYGGLIFSGKTFRIAELDIEEWQLAEAISHDQFGVVELNKTDTRSIAVLAELEVVLDELLTVPFTGRNTANSSSNRSRLASTQTMGVAERMGSNTRNAPERHRVKILPPLTRATFELTHQCNLRCPYCYSASGPKIHSQHLEGQLPASLIASVIAEMNELQIFDVTFTGGEPLLRSDFRSIVAEVGEHSFTSLCVITNGTLVSHRNVDDLGPARQVCVSVDAVGSLHDSIRGQTGAFERTRNAIRLLVERWPLVKILITVSTQNHLEFPSVIKDLTQVGCRRFDVIPVRKLGHIRGQTGLCLTVNQIEALQMAVGQLRSYWSTHGVDVNMNSCYFDVGYDVRAVDTCKYSEYTQGTQLTIGPKGDVFLDRLWGIESIGNVGTDSVSDILRSAEPWIIDLLNEVASRDSVGRLSNAYYDVPREFAVDLGPVANRVSHWPSRRE